ncbi:MAG: WecB/TagA/CpsF family glycosyltransferase [Tissierellia bacterium]|nr:WecB/TagA/CpsF family glycosyltransferase [Tissierellia bacterium]
MKKISIFGVEVQSITLSQGIEEMKKLLHKGAGNTIYTPNTEIVMEARKDSSLCKLINQGDMIVADGIGLVIGSKLRGHPLPERVTGFDLSMELLKIGAEKGYSIFFLGGKPGVAEKAVENVKKDYPDLKIAGFHHGYFKGTHTGSPDHLEEKEVLQSIKASNADILFVGFGFPKQEIWIDKYKNILGTRLLIGNGGVIDVLAGEAKRAPKIFIQLHLEWFYRLLKNPSRWKRQLAIPKFLYYIVRDSNGVREIENRNEEEGFE